VKCRSGRDGSVELTLDADEAALLREIPVQLRFLYDAPTGDPARARLFPRAYLDPTEERAEQEWEALAHAELLRDRLDALEQVLAVLDRAETKGRKVRVGLTSEEVGVWLAVLNDARLAFGTRLGITDDTDVYRIAPDDPARLEKAAYAWLTGLQGELVEAMLRTMPD
jgi:hypothetical protein